jgi:hypothetical protein
MYKETMAMKRMKSPDESIIATPREKGKKKSKNK